MISFSFRGPWLHWRLKEHTRTSECIGRASVVGVGAHSLCDYGTLSLMSRTTSSCHQKN